MRQQGGNTHSSFHVGSMTSPLPVTNRKAAGISYCSFGELLQGVLPEGDVDFLVTLPIQKYSVSCFVPDFDRTSIVTHPSDKTKAAALARVILRHYGQEIGGTLHIDCGIPCGKGLSSSSADLLATARAVEAYMGRELPLADLCGYMSQIEPTDGVMYPESVIYLQRQGRLLARLGRLAEIQILSLDEGGTIDTLEYHRKGLSRTHNQEHREEFNLLLDRMIAAFKRRDLEEVGCVSTRSAQINQKINPKRHLGAVHAVCRDTEGLGMVTSHSGTCLGILYDMRREGHQARLARAIESLSALGSVNIYDTVK